MTKPPKYLIVASAPDVAETFARRNLFVPESWIFMRTPRQFESKKNALAIFLDGWRERPDHARMIQAANEAEFRMIRIVHAAPDQVLETWDA